MRDRNPSAYLMHMRDAAQVVSEYMKVHTFQQFDENDWDQAAIIRNLEIIGEAATNISKEYRREHADIPWQDIIDFRNVAIHQYMEVDNKIVWNILQNNIPLLLEQLSHIIEKLKFDKNSNVDHKKMRFDAFHQINQKPLDKIVYI